jgi:hypothetical protein
VNRYLKVALLEAEISEVVHYRLIQFGDELAPIGGEFLACLEQCFFELSQLAVDSIDLHVALFQTGQLLPGFLAVSYDVRDGRTVLPPQRVQKIDALLELAQSGSIDVELVRVWERPARNSSNWLRLLAGPEEDRCRGRFFEDPAKLVQVQPLESGGKFRFRSEY